MFSKKRLVFLVVYLFLEFSVGQRDKKFFRKDYTYIKEVEAFYKIHTTPLTWVEAKQLCALEGASLFYPEDATEAHTAISLLNRNKPVIPLVVVGIFDLMIKGVFQTNDGKLISEVYDNWGPGEPNNLGGAEDCVLLHIDGTLNDVKCNTKYPFICKKTIQSLEWNNNCNMPQLGIGIPRDMSRDFFSGYSYNEEIGKCYKLHKTPLTWAEAYSVCRTEQSNLAVINNQREADYLARLTDLPPTLRVEGNYLRGVYHLGFHNRFKEGWRTVRDTPFNANTSAWWGNHQPIGNEQCGSMFFNGRLNNIDCNIKCLFICEHEVESIDLSQVAVYT